MSFSSTALLRHIGFFFGALAVLMASIDGTIVVVALPQLTDSLHTSLSWVGWTLTSYQLVQIVMYPLSGKLSDALGRRRVFMFCVITFTVSSLLCAMAPNVGVLILFRALQAVGGGGLMPSVIGIVADAYRDHRAQAIGLISSIMPIGSIVGPNLGGYLLETWTWRSMFLINVPIGILLVVGFLMLRTRNEEEKKAPQRLNVDVVGLLTFTGAIVTLMYAMTVIADDAATVQNPGVWALVVVSVALAVAFVRHVRRTPDGIMEYRLLAGRPFLAANAYNFLFGSVTMGFYSFIPFYAVVKYGLSPFESAAVLSPRAVVVVLTSTLASFSIKRFGYRLPMILGMLFVALNLLLMAQGWDSIHIGPWTLGGFWLLAAMIAIGGFGMGMASPASNNAVIDQAPDRAASITGIRGMFRLAGGTISISCIVLVLSFFSDQAAGLDRIFVVFTCMLVVILPIVLLIPEPSRAAARTAPRQSDQAQPRLRLVPSSAREESLTRSSRVSPGSRST